MKYTVNETETNISLLWHGFNIFKYLIALWWMAFHAIIIKYQIIN